MNLQLRVQVHQPKSPAWTIDHLQSQWAIYLSNCLDTSTKTTYQSGMNLYITFCNLHNLDLDPSPDTLSFFISFMAHQTGPSGRPISIHTISSYLSGIAHHLEPFYPNIRSVRKHPLVVKTLQGVEKTDGHLITCKLLIEDKHLHLLVTKLSSSDDFDNCLFLAICFTAYHGLMRLGELVTPDNPRMLNFCKLSLHHMVEFIQNDSICAFKFNLPTHKADHQYHGNSVVIQSRQMPLDLFQFFPIISMLGILPSSSCLICGFSKMALFLPVLGLLASFISFFPKSFLGTLFKLVVLHILQQSAFLMTRSRLWASGHLRHGIPTFIRTQ